MNEKTPDDSISNNTFDLVGPFLEKLCNRHEGLPPSDQLNPLVIVGKVTAL